VRVDKAGQHVPARQVEHPASSWWRPGGCTRSRDPIAGDEQPSGTWLAVSSGPDGRAGQQGTVHGDPSSPSRTILAVICPSSVRPTGGDTPRSCASASIPAGASSSRGMAAVTNTSLAAERPPATDAPIPYRVVFEG
jgi:hypothetical protein